MTEHHRLAVINNQKLFLTVPETGKSKGEVSAGLVSGGGPLPGS